MTARTRHPVHLGLLLVAAAALAACSSPADDSAGPASDGSTAGQPAAAPAAPSAAAPALPGTGKVVETMDAGSYTYVCVEIGGSPVWAAGPKVDVKVGDTVSLPAGMPMSNYHSKTLDRTFPLVWFVGAIQTAGAPAQDPAAAAAAAHKAVATTTVAAAAPVARLEGGQTVEEIVRKRTDLAGKDVAVRGRVVKYSAGIMGANWLHIQDGTGGTDANDLTVTTDATAAVGDVVVVRGKVTVDKDFGAGYSYAVILEKAAVTKE